MDFKRTSVIAQYLSGKPQVDIVRSLQHLNVNQSFVSRTIKRYNETGSIAKRYGGGRKKTASAAKVVRKVKAQMKKTPDWSIRQMAAQFNISKTTMQRIMKNEIKVKPHKLQKGEDFKDVQKKTKQKKQKD